jgi:hypothetical protein
MLKPFPKTGNELEEKIKKTSNIFSFGGGYKNGGLSDEAWNLISSLNKNRDQELLGGKYCFCAQFLYLLKEKILLFSLEIYKQSKH